MIRKLMSYIAVAVLISGCTTDIVNKDADGGLDYSKMQPVDLGSIATADNVQSRAVGSTPMAVGQTFRLYALPKGVGDLSKLISTRTYTIKTEAGVPVMDEGQDKLYLPMGEIDIFLVGPLQYNMNEGEVDVEGQPLPPSMVDVATEQGVYPQYGVDLVSSKTALKVKVGANQFQAEPLVHRMAQMEVVVKRPSDAMYTDMNVTQISVMNQTLNGEFVFNDKGGEITPAEEGTQTLYPNIREITAAEEYRATMYVIPRKMGQLRIGVFMSCKTDEAGAEQELRMESGIMEDPLVAGVMNRFTTKPNISSDLIFRLRLMPWNDQTMEDENISALDGLVFSYSGMDAPIKIGEKMYIPDRSGNGNHGELVGDIKYNAEQKYYYASKAGAYIMVPKLGVLPVHTLELTAEATRHTRAKAASFMSSDGSTALSVSLPFFNNEINFASAGGSAYTNNNARDLAWMENLAVYAFAREATAAKIYRNGVLLEQNSLPTFTKSMDDNKLMFWDGTIGDPKMKLYAARMLTTTDINELQNNYKNDLSTFLAINADKIYANQKYITDGMILNLDGYTPPVSHTLNGATFKVWPDLSDMKNHARIYGNVTHNATNKCYDFTGAIDTYMQLIGTLGTIQEFTIEFVAVATTGKMSLFCFSSTLQGGNNGREFSINYLYDNSLYFNAPYRAGQAGIKYAPYPNSGYVTYADYATAPHSWSIVRTKEGEYYRLSATNAGVALSNAGDILGHESNSTLREMRTNFIGCNGYNGSTIHQNIDKPVHAVRVYNRVLTPQERRHNYQVDKIKYNLVP